MDWFLYDNDLRHERVKLFFRLTKVRGLSIFYHQSIFFQALLFTLTRETFVRVNNPNKTVLMVVCQRKIGQKWIKWWLHQWAWSKCVMLLCGYHSKVLDMDFHQKWTWYGISIEHSSKTNAIRCFTQRLSLSSKSLPSLAIRGCSRQ